jgi:hypothetical protein
MNKNSLIRIIYLYLFACIGLVLLTIGTVQLVNLGLKMFVFTKAETSYMAYPPRLMTTIAKEDDFILAIEKCEEKCELTETQQKQLENWLQDYEVWQESEAKQDYKAERRHRDASMALALILIGLPLYLYHWTVIKRDTKKA